MAGTAPMDAAGHALAARETFLEVGDGRIRAVLLGEGPPLLLLHGWTLDARMWRPQFALADRYRLIMPDRRGFGGSSAPPCLEREHEDLLRLLDHLRIADAAVAGLSQGAVIALDFARRHPGRVSRLALFGAPLAGLVPDATASEQLPREHYAALVRGGRLDEMKALWRAHPLTQSGPATMALFEEILGDYEGRDQMVDQRPVLFAEADVAGLPMPLLAATGAHDSQWRRDGVAWLGRTAPDVVTTIFEGAGHLCNIDDPAAFNAALVDFLTRS